MSSSLRWQEWVKNREKVTTESAGEDPVSSVSADTPKVFPHCPRCSSFDLYRPNNIGSYSCETCGLENISPEVARRVQ
jgi:hypothetical protein